MPLHFLPHGVRSRWQWCANTALVSCICWGITPVYAQSNSGALTPQPAAAFSGIQVRTPQGKLLTTKSLRWQVPTSTQLHYRVQGKYKGFPFQTTAQLGWHTQGQTYDAYQEVIIPVAGPRRQSSTGTLTAKGIAPSIFMDASRNRERSATFNPQTSSIRFSRSGDTSSLPAGTQDRVSVFFQLAGLLAAAPQQYPAGTRITIPTAGTNRVASWTFVVRAKQPLQLPAGRMTALQLEHLPDSTDGDDLQTTLWLSPQQQYLPVRIQMREDGGRDELDLQLQNSPNIARP